MWWRAWATMWLAFTLIWWQTHVAEILGHLLKTTTNTNGWFCYSILHLRCIDKLSHMKKHRGRMTYPCQYWHDCNLMPGSTRGTGQKDDKQRSRLSIVSGLNAQIKYWLARHQHWQKNTCKWRWRNEVLKYGLAWMLRKGFRLKVYIFVLQEEFALSSYVMQVFPALLESSVTIIPHLTEQGLQMPFR